DHPTGWGSPKASNLLAHLGVQGPTGTLEGTVTDAAGGNPLVNAKVTVTPGNISRLTPNDGTYLILLAPGTYTLTVTEYGYKVGTASVTITDGDITTQDFSMQTAPSATVSGKVEDGSGHGYGLYAEIKVTSPGFGQVADVWSNPANGSYSVSLPEGFDYSFSVAAALDGYNEGSWTVTDLDGDQTHNFTLSVSVACTAPGYEFDQGFGADFNGNFPPAGWSTNAVSTVKWAATHGGFGFNNLPNFTGGSGEGAVANAGGTLIQNHPFDAQLITPPIPVTSLPASSMLTFLVNYQHTLNDALDVDISGDGGTTWTTMAHIVTSYGAFKSTPGASYSINLSDYIPSGAIDIQIRWRYVNSVNYIGNYAEVDDVSIGICKALNGGLVFGQITDGNTGNGVVGAAVSDDQGDRVATLANPADPNFPLGGYLVFAPAGNRTLTVSDYNYADANANFDLNPNTVTTQNLSLKAGQLAPKPEALDVEASVDGTTEEALTIANTGLVSAQFNVRKINLPTPASVAPALRFTGSVPSLVQTGNNRKPAVLAATSVVPGSGARSALTKPTAGPAAQTAGVVIATFHTGMPTYSLGVDHDANDLWVGSPVNNGGDDQDHRFLFSGTNTGDAINVAFPDAYFMADMAYDDNTGKLWQLSVPQKGSASCIHELDPITRQPTGKKICPPFPAYQIGLAYDPVGNTWITGDFHSMRLYQVNGQGQIIGSAQIGIPIEGLAYNPGTGHLFVLTSGGHHAVYVYDATKGFLTPPTYFDIPGFNQQNSGAGLGYDCDGHLWISDEVDNEVFEVASGEKGWCVIKHVPWLTISPAAGTLAQGKSAAVSLEINGAGQKAFTTSRVQLKLSGTTPYPVTTIPVTVHWVPQPVDLVLTGTAAPAPVQKGGGLVYSLTVKNAQEAGHGSATETELTYDVPAGASYVSGSGDGVTCAAQAPGSTVAPAVTSASGVVRCDLGTLAPGASKTVTIAITANTAGTLTSVFSVKSRELGSDSDSATISLETAVLGTADVGVSAGSNVTIKQGAPGTIKLVVNNAGPDTATDVELKLSAAGSDVSLQSASSSAGSCAAPSSNTIDCNLGEMAAKGTVTVTIDMLGAQPGSATVTGQATTSANDSNPDNNLAQAEVTVEAASNGGGGNKGGGGGGALGWLVLAALLGLTLVSACNGYRRS
ncbi:MAG: carboxypeptidase regulatory-like domain-containing protein, partial [Gammaproteobacteria bacterium]